METEVVRKILEEKFPDETFEVYVDERNLVHLSGEASVWQKVIDIGHEAAAVPGVRNVINNMTAKGVTLKKPDYASYEKKGREIGVVDKADVVIIGAGITGCGVARELSKYDLKIIVLEKGDDVASGCTKANNGVIHHGMLVKPYTLKAKLNRLGNARYDDWEREMHVGLKKPGSLEIIESMDDYPKLVNKLEYALRNEVPGVSVVTGERAYELEPALKKEGINVVAAIYLPNWGVIETPYACFAVAENAAHNGVKFEFNTSVGAIDTEDGKVKAVVTDKGIYEATYVVNAAGMYGDDIAAMAGDQLYTIHNRRGTLAVYDKSTPPTFHMAINFNSPRRDETGRDKESKGGIGHPTPENNLMAGPSAEEVPDKEDTRTCAPGIEYIERSCMQDPNNPMSNIIKLYGGARPADYKEDFTIEMSEITDGFVHASCIQSPGVASAPAVADMVVDIIVDDTKKKGKEAKLRDDFDPYREAPVEFRHMTKEEQAALIEKDPAYGRIICRCEHVTEGEIRDMFKSPLPPRSVNAVKNRTRAGMGRCQGGFCQPRVVEMLAEFWGKDWTDVTLRGEGSEILIKDDREG